MIDFVCKYDSLYTGIEANNINVSGENIDVDAHGGEGKFSFTLEQYTDSNYTTTTDEDNEVSLPSNLFFKLTMDSPIPELNYIIQGE